MREIRQSGSEGGARFNPLSLPLSADSRWLRVVAVSRCARWPFRECRNGRELRDPPRSATALLPEWPRYHVLGTPGREECVARG